MKKIVIMFFVMVVLGKVMSQTAGSYPVQNAKITSISSENVNDDRRFVVYFNSSQSATFFESDFSSTEGFNRAYATILAGFTNTSFVSLYKYDNKVGVTKIFLSHEPISF